MPVQFAAPILRTSVSDGTRRFQAVADGLSLNAGEMLAITGESGSGKTLLLETLGLLRRPDIGADYRIEGLEEPISLSDVWETPDAQAQLARLRREIFGFVPQVGGLLAFLNVRDNIALAQRLFGANEPDYLAYLLDVLGLGKLSLQMPDTLSMGERQRVAIARALAHRPFIVIADEPTAALDPFLAEEVMTLFVGLATEQGTAVLISTHNTGLVETLGLPRMEMRLETEAAVGVAGESMTNLVSRLRSVTADASVN